jgi:hypothetical protein
MWGGERNKMELVAGRGMMVAFGIRVDLVLAERLPRWKRGVDVVRERAALLRWWLRSAANAG